MGTNAFSSRVGVALADLVEGMGGKPKFAKFATRLAGEMQGGVRRGDHVVENVVLLGVSYTNMVQRSHDALSAAASSPTFVADTVAACAAAGVTDEIKGKAITDADVRDALDGTARGRKGLLTAYGETLANANNDSTSAHVYEPLTVDGDVVDGAKVYTGKGNANDPKAPIAGAVYLAGVTMSSKVVTPSVNGDKLVGKQGAVAAVKSYLEHTLALPASRYRTYRILPGEQYEVVCGTVAFHAALGGNAVRGAVSP